MDLNTGTEILVKICPQVAKDELCKKRETPRKPEYREVHRTKRLIEEF